MVENASKDSPDASAIWDVLIIGGGPAGLSAALTLLRARRKVVLVDRGEQRNLVSPRMHGFLSRDGMPPADFLTYCRQELESYDAFTFAKGTVVHCHKEGDLFASEVNGTGDHQRLRSRAVLLATGVSDTLPAIPGIEEFYGTGAHHCPYCDGWEHRDQSIVVYGEDARAADLAWELTGWSAKVTLVIPRKSALRSAELVRCEKSGVALVESTPIRLEGERGELSRVVLSDGQELAAGAFFFVTEEAPRSELADLLQCEREGEHPKVGQNHCTSVEGCFAAGNMCKGRNMVVIAAAQGATAAIAIHEYLLEQF